MSENKINRIQPKSANELTYIKSLGYESADELSFKNIDTHIQSSKNKTKKSVIYKIYYNYHVFA